MVINLNFTLSSVDADRLLRYKEKDKCEHLSTNDYAKKLLEDELFKKCFTKSIVFNHQLCYYKNKKGEINMFIDFISCAIALFVVFGIPSLLDRKASEQRSKNLEEEFRKRENY